MAASFRSEKTEVRVSATSGRGLFAKTIIRKGEIVSVRGGHILSKTMETDLIKPNNYWAYPISDEHVLAPTTDEEVETVMMFLNHSCSPNIGILGQILFVAMRDIAADEELAVDYAMFGGDPIPMNCNCNTSDCRKVIKHADWQNKTLQEKYKGYFSAFVQRKIDLGH